MMSQENPFGQQDWPQLVEAARSGCEDSLGEIIVRLRGYLLLIANGQMRGSLQAKFGASDIVQNSLLDAYAGIDEFSGTTEAEMRAWLKQIVLHNFIDEKRRYTQTQSRSIDRERPLDSLVASLPAGVFESGRKKMRQAEQLQQFAAAVERLSPRQQRVIEGRRRFGYSYKQIADQLGITEAAAKTLGSRAIRQLRGFLAEED